MIKTIFSKKGLLFGLLLICLTEAVYIGHLMKKNTFLKEKLEKQQEELNATLEKNEIYEIYKSRIERFAGIPLKITDGKKKYILLTNLAYLKARMFKYNGNNKIDLYGYSVFLTILADSKYYLYIEPEEFKYFKKHMPFYVPVEDYEKFAKKHENMTLKQFLNKYAIYVKNRGYKINDKIIKTPQMEIIIETYLFHKYRIFVMANCLGIRENYLAGKALKRLNEK